MDDYYSDSQPALIHCKFCGEDYAATYKYCPFCNTAPNGKKMGPSARNKQKRGGGARVRTNTRGGGYGGARSPLAVVGIVAAVVLVVAAIVAVVLLVKSALNKTVTPPADASGSAVTSQVDSSAAGSGESADVQQTPGDAQQAAAESITLSADALSLDAGGASQLTVSVGPEGWAGQIIWTTSDANVAAVDENGNVTYVGAGSCTITASAGSVSAQCAVTCNEAAPAEPAAPAEEAITVTAYGNTMDGDFTVKVGEVVPFKAVGGDGSNYAWAIEDGSVASVDPTTGSCTGLTAGKTKMTVTSGTQSVTVTVRVVG